MQRKCHLVAPDLIRGLAFLPTQFAAKMLKSREIGLFHVELFHRYR